MRRQVEVRSADDSVETFYALMRVTGTRDGFGIHSLAYYRRALDLFAPTGRATLLMAYYEDQPLAGLMTFAFGGQAWYLYGASSDLQRNLMPNHQLQWRAMLWARERGCRQYDLWGITDTDDDSPTAELVGVERFKSGFGGETVRYVGAFDYVYSRPLYWLMGKAMGRRRSGIGPS